VKRLQFSSAAQEQSTDIPNGMKSRDSKTKRTMNINNKGLHSVYHPAGWKVVPWQLSQYFQGSKNSHCCAYALALPAVRFLLLLLRWIECDFTAVVRWQYFCHYACCQLTESRSTAVASGGDHKMFYLKKVPLHWKRVGTAAGDCTDLLPSYGRKFFLLSRDKPQF